jgi:signal transduction histidine kinase
MDRSDQRPDDDGVKAAATVERSVPGAGAREAAAWVLWWIPIVALAAGFVGATLEREWPLLPLIPALAVQPTVGLLITLRQPANRLGWLLLGTAGVVVPAIVCGAYAELALRTGAEWPGIHVAAWLSQFAGAPLLIFGVLLPLLFPTGRLLSMRWRPVAWLGVTGPTMIAFHSLFGPTLDSVQIDNPLAWREGEALAATIGDVGWAIWYLAVIAAFGSLVVRWRRADRVRRQQLKWLLYAGALLFAALSLFVVSGLVGMSTDVAILTTSMMLSIGLPAAVGVAVLRYERYDIDVIIQRTLVYGVLWTLIVAAYIGAAVLFGIAAGNRLPLWLAIVGTILVTVAFDPVRRRLTRVAERWVYGEQPSGLQVLSRLSTTVTTSTDPAVLLHEVAAALWVGLGPTWCRVALAGGDTATAGSGCTDRPALVVALERRGVRLGSIECGPRADGRRYGKADRQLVGAVGAQAALAAHNAELAERLVSVTDAERVRIGRDIHDGAQQTLVAIMTKLRLARRQLVRDQAGAGLTLAELLDDTALLVAELRELAQGIHPTALAEGGLVEAVRERCARLPLQITVEADEGIERDRVAAAVESAAYFVVSEPLANTLKHAGATSARVVMRRSSEQVTVEVSDDGSGFNPDQGGLRGLAGVADRVAALGGSFQVQSQPSDGATVHATIPAAACDSEGTVTDVAR